MAHDGEVIIGLLGPIAVIGGSAPDGTLDRARITVIAGVRAKRLLVSLALAGGRTRSADRLIDDVWGADPPRSPASALHTQISRLRQVLGPQHLVASGNGYRLVDCRTDLDVVAALVAGADESVLAVAESWWRGVPGDDLGADAPGGLVDEVAAAAARVTETLDRHRFAAAVAAGDHATARTLAEKRCRADPLDESAHLDLMRVLAAEGRTADAIALFGRLRRRLAGELGVDPGAAISALHAELLAGPPRPAARGSRGHGLAAETTELIGRDHDVAAIDRLLATHRLITVQGPGGVGKTRVANRVGTMVADRGTVVFYVPLAPIRDDHDVVPAIAAALGVGEVEVGNTRRRRSVGDLADRLADALRGRKTLLILDNCEQVVDACARVVADLLADEPGVAVLATSRAPLQLAAEHIYPLPVLDVDADGAAVRLFTARARAIRPGAELPREAVARLCRELDGLPLAIELAAARIRTMTIEEIAERLAERFALLRGADRTAPDRHRTLHAVIDWSWDLLGPDERRALGRLCRFAGGFTAEAASIVLGCRGFRLDDILGGLVNQSLLQVAENNGRVRYRMLEMVREFGEEKLDDATAVDDAMCRWARGFSERAIARYHREGLRVGLLAEVAAEAGNLVWVLRRCTAVEVDSRPDDFAGTIVAVFPALAGLWSVRGLHAEILGWSPRLLDALPMPPAQMADAQRDSWEATVLAAMLHLLMRRDLRSIARGRWLLRGLHRPDRTFTAPTEFAAALVLSHTATAALRLLVRAVDHGSAEVEVAATILRSNLRDNSGAPELALRDGLVLVETARTGGDVWLAGMADVSVAGIYGQRAQWRPAVDHYRRGIAALDRLGAIDDGRQARCFLVCALVALGETAAAAAEFEIVADGWRVGDPDPQGNPEVVAALMLTAAEIEYAGGRTDLAVDLFARSAVLIRREHPLVAQDPGAVMLVSGAVAGLVRAGAVGRAAEFFDALRDGVRATFGRTGWLDLPQAGAMALTAGMILRADPIAPGQRRGPTAAADGAELVAAGVRLGARQDCPSLHHCVDNAQAASGLTDAAWAELSARWAGYARKRAIEKVLEIVGRY
ncbi:MAG: BTAD domain-containing putative transcriptional regulator [Gordonia sp. (in: high G+C Gram-positive bacteria)]